MDKLFLTTAMVLKKLHTILCTTIKRTIAHSKLIKINVKHTREKRWSPAPLKRKVFKLKKFSQAIKDIISFKCG